MAYTPTEWQTGDIITAEKLNKAEEGIAAASFVVTGSYENGTLTLDQETQDIISACVTGNCAVAFIKDQSNGGNVVLHLISFDPTEGDETLTFQYMSGSFDSGAGKYTIDHTIQLTYDSGIWAYRDLSDTGDDQ